MYEADRYLRRLSGRATRSGPEAKLVETVLNTKLPTDGRLPRFVYLEPELPTGFPDIVIAYYSERGLSYLPARTYLTNRHIQLLDHVFTSGGTSLSTLESNLFYSRRELRKLLSDLVSAGLLNINGSYVRHRSLKTVFGLRRLVAIEVKISKWRKALEQAAANTWFASDSFILIPHRRDLKDVVKAANSIGVGVFCFDGNKVITIHPAKRFSLPSSYGSWIFNEMVLQKLNIGYSSDRY